MRGVMRGMMGAGLVLAFAAGCGTPKPGEEATPAAEPPAIAREQLFFAGHDADGPVLAALILQREPRGDGAWLEAKGFVAMGGELKTPFYERAELTAWPGDDVPSALEAWRAARTGAPMRIRWEEQVGLTASVRTAGAALKLTVHEPSPAGASAGPHGSIRWRASTATLEVDGKKITGVGAVETLRGTIANPAFGRFEMWVVAPSDGSLVLGRVTLGGTGEGTALRVNRQGRGDPEGFAVAVTGQRKHEPTGFEVPTAWTLGGPGGLTLSRVGGNEPVVGQTASGGPAVYDIGLATSEDGRAAALVFHLQDAPR